MSHPERHIHAISIRIVEFYFLLLVLFSFTAVAQPKWKLDVDGKVEENGKTVEGAQVKIFRGSTEVATVYSASNGKFKYTLEPNFDYTIKITKPGGYITKQIFISTKNVPATEDERDGFQPFKMEVNIFKEMPGLDVSILKQPVGKIYFDESANNFQYDKAYTQSILAQLEQLTEELAKKLAEEAEAAAQAAKKKMEFDKLINQGDATLNANNLDKALEIFTKALDLQVDNATANARIAKVNKLKTEEEAKKKADEETKKKAEAEAALKAEAAKKRAEFDKKIADGDAALTKKKFDEALTSYQAALALNVDNPAANAKIANANKSKSEEEARLKAEEEVRKKNEADAAAKAEAAKKKAEFDKKIAEGDALLLKKKFDEAKQSFQLALAMNVDNPAAESKLKAVEDARKADQDAAAKAEQDKKKAAFDKVIADGDGLLLKKKFDEAIAQFQQALAMGVDNSTAEARIKSASDAKKAEQDAAAKAEQDKKKAAFDKLISEGDASLSQSKFDEAIASYQKALVLAFDNAAAEAKIKSATDAKKKAEDEAKNKEEAARKKAEFEKALAEGDAGLAKKSFDAALAAFQKALTTGYDNSTAEARINSLNNARKAEQDAAARAEMEKKKAEFDKKIQEGDAALGKKKFDEATAAFQAALAMGVDNPAAEARIKSVEDAKKAESDAAARAEMEKKKAEFDKKIQEGDAALGKKKFDEATAAFQAALAMGIDNPAAEARIKSVEDAKKAESDAAARAEMEKKKVEFEKYLTEGDAVIPSGRFDEAIKSYSKALQMGFDNPAAEARIRAAEEAKRKAEDEAKNKAENERKRADFDKAMKDGQEALDKKKYDDALLQFQQALTLGVDNAAAEAKIKAVGDARKAEEDANAKAKSDKKKAEFDKLISSGNDKLSQNKFEDALDEYRGALALNHDNPAAEAKIKEAEAARSAAEEARKKQAEEEKNKAELEKKKAAFDSFIKEGDKSLGSSSFDEALVSFRAALALNVNNPLAEAKISEVEKAKKEAEDAKLLKEAADKKQAFDKLISDGDLALSKKKFEDALSRFQAALDLHVDDNLANARISALKDARDSDEKARKAEEEKAQKQKQFEKAMEIAEEMYKGKKFDDALSSFEAALSMHIDDAKVNQRIEQVKKDRDLESARMKAEEEERLKREAAQKKADFDAIIARGDKKAAEKSWEAALFEYNQALGMKVDDNLVNARIKAIEEARNKEDEARRKAAEEEQKKADEARRKQDFENLLKIAQEQIRSKTFDGAATSLNDAMGMNIDNKRVKDLQAELDRAKAEEDARRQKEEEERKKSDAARVAAEFGKYIAQGDRELTSNNFDVAIASYKLALDLHVDDATASAKISEAEKARDKYEARLAEEEEKRRKEEEAARLKMEAAQRKIDFEKKIKEGDQAMLGKLFDSAVDAYQTALDLHVQDELARKKLDEAIKKRDDAEKKKRLKEEQIAKMEEEARKKREAMEQRRLEQEAKRKGIDEELARKKAEADERERLFRERAKLENEKRQAEIRSKIEAQKAALALMNGVKKEKPMVTKEPTEKPEKPQGPSRYDLADKYPQGITQEEIDGPNCTITRVVVVKGKLGDEYKKIRFNWGQTSYKKNGRDITEQVFIKETTRR